MQDAALEQERRLLMNLGKLQEAAGAAFAALSSLPVYGRSWTEVTNRPYNLDDPRYRDPFASNSSGGWGLASGRMTGIAVGGGAIYIGGATAEGRPAHAIGG